MRCLRFAALMALAFAPRAVAQFSPSRFVPAVEFRDTVGNCAQPAASLQPGERGFSLRFGDADSAARIVTAIWRRDGKLLSYSDTRGDLRPPFPADVRRSPQRSRTSSGGSDNGTGRNL